MADSGHKIATGQAGWQDVVGLAMLLSPVHEAVKKEPKANEPIKEGEQPKIEEETAPKIENIEKEAPKKEGVDGEAYEEGVSTKAKGDIGEAKVIEELKAQGYTDILQIQNNSGHGVDVIGRNAKGEVKCVEVKANTSQLSADQAKGGEWYVNDRLKKIETESKFNKIPPNPPELKANAETARQWIDEAPKVEYEVHQVPVDNTTGVAGTPNVKPWEPKP